MVDAYTRRILERHELITPGAKYDEIRGLMERALQGREQTSDTGEKSADPKRPQAHPASPMSTAQRSSLAQTYNEMHGLLVQAGKHYCQKQQAKCELCPLAPLLPDNLKAGRTKRGRPASKRA